MMRIDKNELNSYVEFPVVASLLKARGKCTWIEMLNIIQHIVVMIYSAARPDFKDRRGGVVEEP
jgi:hypothetical protein